MQGGTLVNGGLKESRRLVKIKSTRLAPKKQGPISQMGRRKKRPNNPVAEGEGRRVVTLVLPMSNEMIKKRGTKWEGTASLQCAKYRS